MSSTQQTRISDRGVFLSFEGGEGCGKSTQIHLLSDWLGQRGGQVEVFREPGGTELGEHVRQILQHNKEMENMASEAELLLFAASRAQLVREKILPALNAGAVVLCDRFLDSTTVYQGIARKLPPDRVAEINAFATGGLLPDKTFLLDLDSSIAMSRLSLRKSGQYDRMEAQPIEFHQAVRDGYLDLAAEEIQRIAIIDAAAEPAEMFLEIFEILRPIFQQHGILSS